MFNFNLREADIFRAIVWNRNPCFRYADILKKLFSVFFIIIFLLFLYGFVPSNLTPSSNRKMLALSILSLVFSIFFGMIESFSNINLKKPQIKSSIEEILSEPEKFNLAESLNFETARVIYSSLRFAKPSKTKSSETSVRLEKINSTILFWFLLKDNPKLNFVFSRAILDLKETKKLLKEELKDLKSKKWGKEYSEDFQDSILESLKIAKEKGHSRIETGDMLSALAKHNKIFKKILMNSNLKAEDITNICWWLEDLEKTIKEGKKFWEYKNLLKRGSIAKDWAAGYTITLDKFSTDWSDIVRIKSFREIVGLKKELSAMERILCRNEINNVLLIGEPGQGRMKLIQELARRALFGLSFPQINSKRIVSLDIISVLSRAGSREKAEAILDKIFQEVISAKNVILVIDDFHNYIGQEPRPGIVDISGIITSYLSLPDFQMIAITNYPGLHKFIEPNTSVLNLFGKVEIPEIPERDTVRILQNRIPTLERKYKIFVSYPAIRDIVKYSARYLASIPFPKKAIDLLDETMVYVANFTKSKILLPQHAARIISDKTQIPIGEIEIKEKELLLNLEDLIHKRIINQNEAVNEVSSALRRARSGITIRKGPMGSFLFLGPTGVGKTETSKSLAQIYFGSESRMIRLDMSEFQNTLDISRLIGSPGEEGLLTTKVKEDPFSLILLDEVEKAHPKILNLFLQILDEGHLTDGSGRKVDFKNTIIIATSNAGYLIILDAIKKNRKMSEIKDKLLESLFEKGTFRPEFINRFDAVVLFKSLSKENLLDISELILRKLKKNLKQKDIELIITPEIKEKIVELGYNPKFGARELKRVIQDRIGNILAKALLSNQIKRGDRVEIEPEEFKLRVNP